MRSPGGQQHPLNPNSISPSGFVYFMVLVVEVDRKGKVKRNQRQRRKKQKALPKN
jgi:hypothetical protein